MSSDWWSKAGAVAGIPLSITYGATDAGASGNWDAGDTSTVGRSQYEREAPAVNNPMDFERLVDAKLEAVEARTDTKFAELMGEMKLISSGLDGLRTQMGEIKSATASVKWNIIATGIAIGALILGLFAYGTQMFELAAGLVGARG